MIGLQLKQMLIQMQEGKFADPDGDKEAKVIQALRVEKDPVIIQELCSALSAGGSWYAVPTLIARFQKTSTQEEKATYFHSLWGIRSRMDWETDLLDTFFDAGFWRMRWVGSAGRFISFITVLTGPDFEDQQKTEQLAQAVGREMGFSFARFATFHEFKLCTKDWNIAADMQEVLDEVRQAGNMDALIMELSLSRDLSSQIKDSIIGMRSDYLVNRLGLAERFDFYHTLIGRAICLNVREGQ